MRPFLPWLGTKGPSWLSASEALPSEQSLGEGGHGGTGGSREATFPQSLQPVKGGRAFAAAWQGSVKT
ncbi:hypothetical protein [Lysobacter terrae]